MCITNHMRATVDAPLDPVRSPVVLKTVLTSTAAAAALLAPLAPAHSAPPAAPLATSTLRPTKIRLTLTPETLGIGERLRIQGVGYRTDTYSPIVDRTVYIQSRPAWTTRPWRTTTTVRTNAYGQFTYVRTVDRSRQYRAVISATTRDAKAVSKAEINRATPGVWTNVSAHVSRTTTGRTKVAGRLTRVEGGRPVPLRWVVVEARLEGETRWYKVDSDRATTQGWWAINHWPPPGSCRTYRATFGGDSVFAGKSRRTIWSGCS